MEKVLKLIQKKAKNLTILSVALLIVINGSLYFIIKGDKTMTDMFKPICEVHTKEDLKKCYSNNSYVRIYLNDVYTTEYGYYKNDNLLAYYIDIDIDGYSLITIVNKDLGEKIFDDEEKVDSIDGFITLFDEEESHKGVMNSIKKNYLEQFGENWTKEDIDDTFVPFQIDAYKNVKSENIILLAVFGIIDLVLLWIFGKSIYLIIYPNKNKSYQKIKDKELLNLELEEKILFQNKEFYLTPSYIIYSSPWNTKFKEKNLLVWIYPKITKQYGITVDKCYMLCFKDGDSFAIHMKEEKDTHYFDDIALIGYNQENLKEYRKIVEGYKKELKLN